MNERKPKNAADGPSKFADQDIKQRPLDWRLIRRMYTFTVPYAAKRNVLLVLVLIRAIQLPLIGWSIAKVISGPIARHDVSGTVLGAIGFISLVAVTELVFTFRMYLALGLGENIAFDMRKQLYEHVLAMPLSFFNRMPLGRLISRVTSDVDVVRTGIQDVFFVSTVQAGSMVIAALLMLYYDWVLFCVVLLIVPIFWKLIRHFTVKLSKAHRDVQETYSRLTSSLAESVNGIRVIQGFARHARNDERFGRIIDVHSENNMRAAKQGAVLLPSLEFNGQLFLAIVVVVGGYQAVSGSIDLEALIQFLFLSEVLFGPVPILGRQYDQALTAMAGAERVFGLLDLRPEWQDHPEARDIPNIEGRVAFRDVYFEYESGRPVLSGIGFDVLAGQTIALVGETGSGKTTITRLLSKLYLPSAGRVSIDDVDVRNIRSDALHRFLGCVPQDNYLFSGTVRENIRFAKPSASDDEIMDTLRRLDILDLFEELPKGLSTEVGEKGASLSLGQRQLVCFGRALLADPRILILDEATSSVDAITEDRLQRALERLLAGRTSFVVAHRLSTIRHADRILVMDNGHLVESGTHLELLARDGVYTRLFRNYAHGLLAP